MNDHHSAQTHIVGYGTYILIWLSLMSLSGLTVAVAGFDLGRWTVLTALAIATIKSALVLSVFMHMKFEDRLFRIFLFIAVLTLLIFFAMTFFDYAYL
jgi:cytochrome c oxidase subunit IV